MSMPDFPEFREGSEAAQAASKGVQFAKIEFFGIEKDGGTAILRFLHDYVTHRNADGSPMYPHLAHPSQPGSTAWIVVNQHSYVPTRSAPEGYKGNWPSMMGAVCRKDKAFGGAFPDCYICDFMTKSDGKKFSDTGRTWALAVMREEVKENGVIVGYRDMTREIAKVDAEGKPTGEKTIEKRIVVVNMGWKNFFSTLESIGKVKGTTILDKDFHIVRKGTSTETDYGIVDLDPITMSDGTRFDLRNPAHYERYANEIDIPKLITERAADEFYVRFFDVRQSNAIATKDDNSGGAPAEQQGKPETDAVADDERMRAIADRVTKYASEPGNGAEPAPAPAPAPAEGQQPATEQPAAAPAPQPAVAGARNFDE